MNYKTMWYELKNNLYAMKDETDNYSWKKEYVEELLAQMDMKEISAVLNTEGGILDADV